MTNGHSFDAEGRCIRCEIAHHKAHEHYCAVAPNQMVLDIPEVLDHET